MDQSGDSERGGVRALHREHQGEGRPGVQDLGGECHRGQLAG